MPSRQTTTRTDFPAPFDQDSNCIGCGEPIADACAPQCPREAIDSAVKDGARMISAAEIAIHVDDYDHMWWVIAQHLANRWIRPGSYLATVAHEGRQLAPFSWGDHDTAEAAAEQVRGNLAYYAHGWVVTSIGAFEVRR